MSPSAASVHRLLRLAAEGSLVSADKCLGEARTSLRWVCPPTAIVLSHWLGTANVLTQTPNAREFTGAATRTTGHDAVQSIKPNCCIFITTFSPISTCRVKCIHLGPYYYTNEGNLGRYQVGKITSFCSGRSAYLDTEKHPRLLHPLGETSGSDLFRQNKNRNRRISLDILDSGY